jgi:hypothetical protein
MTYGPTIRNRASICAWNLQFRFYDKQQCTKFITAYMELEVSGADNIKYSTITGDSLTLDEHWVSIEEGVWASNLSTIAKLLEDVDYGEVKEGLEE